MDIRTYITVTAANLALLATGAMIGPTIVSSFRSLRVVHAQEEKARRNQ